MKSMKNNTMKNVWKKNVTKNYAKMQSTEDEECEYPNLCITCPAHNPSDVPTLKSRADNEGIG